jgi:uncharacterized membrane protein
MKFALLKVLILSLLLGGMVLGRADSPAGQRSERATSERSEQDKNARPNPDNKPAQDENARKQSKLSPEERKALRQQINEAGQDLYQRKR